MKNKRHQMRAVVNPKTMKYKNNKNNLPSDFRLESLEKLEKEDWKDEKKKIEKSHRFRNMKKTQKTMPQKLFKIESLSNSMN